MAKFKKGDKVCALLVANRWGVDLTCFVGTLEKVEKTERNLTAKIMVTKHIWLTDSKVHKPTQFTLDIRLFKLLHWNKDTKEHLRALRKSGKELNAMTQKVRSL